MKMSIWRWQQRNNYKKAMTTCDCQPTSAIYSTHRRNSTVCSHLFFFKMIRIWKETRNFFLFLIFFYTYSKRMFFKSSQSDQYNNISPYHSSKHSFEQIIQVIFKFYIIADWSKKKTQQTYAEISQPIRLYCLKLTHLLHIYLYTYTIAVSLSFIGESLRLKNNTWFVSFFKLNVHGSKLLEAIFSGPMVRRFLGTETLAAHIRVSKQR